ncbi:uncharacterized protein ASPGLDRAFT_62550 [Aspergillus glaucus CBS 516.65]|uniref:Uncharacterized protein n=1 Tax=Aspergillus glaucus CBS 516.65 TaxID=1160497 RepID=A0A1L9V3C6_ASPGL|nr:hypothetical protein ASPGLDRAFT_62550 [Aspergillus glaucus CBS 516.65]OJJ78420.1 hypothetical protein ASPGLDRAFT_62550 [Aspergillus glaucus CBS 516.65]
MQSPHDALVTSTRPLAQVMPPRVSQSPRDALVTSTRPPTLQQTRSPSSAQAGPSTPHPGPNQVSHALPVPRKVHMANRILGPPSLPEAPGSEAGSIDLDGSFFFMHRDDGSHTQISAHDAFLKLDQLARQQFIMSLNNWEVEEPVEHVFPSMSANDAMFRTAVQKVRDLYKTWKN